MQKYVVGVGKVGYEESGEGLKWKKLSAISRDIPSWAAWRKDN